MRRLSLLLVVISMLAVSACIAHYQASRYYDRGRALGDKFDRKGAIAEYTKAIEIDPTYVKAYLNRGMERGAIDDHEGAIADLTRVIELDPSVMQAYLSRGAERIFTKDDDGALADFTKTIELDPRQPAAYNNRAIVYKRQGKFDLAAADEKKAHELYTIR